MCVYLWNVEIEMKDELNHQFKDAKTLIALSWLGDRLANHGWLLSQTGD